LTQNQIDDGQDALKHTCDNWLVTSNPMVKKYSRLDCSYMRRKRRACNGRKFVRYCDKVSSLKQYQNIRNQKLTSKLNARSLETPQQIRMQALVTFAYGYASGQ
jgi:hypothetical protein